MSILDNLKEDAKHDLGHVEEKLKTTEGRSWVKYAAYGMIGLVILTFSACVLQSVFAPRKMVQQLDYSQPQVVQAQVAQPVYQNNPDPMAGVLTGMVIGSMMSNGQRYDGRNGYMDSHYSGPPRTIVVNKTVVINKPAVAPVVNTPAPVVAKVANPGDAAAEQARKQDALKAELKAKQAVRASAPAPKSSGFASFSKSVSSSSSRSSGGRR